MPARQQAPTQGGQPQMSHMGPRHTNAQGEYTRYYTNQQGDMNPGVTPGAALGQQAYGGEMIKRADGSYSKRGLWDNIRANKGSGKKPTKEMLKQEAKIRAEYAYGGSYAQGGEPNGGMALGQMAAVVDKMSKLRKFVSPDQNLDPWIASKLAVMDHSADAISDYMMYNPEAQGEGMEDMMAYGGGMFAEGGSFGKAFAAARRELGAGKTFTWKGKEYSTNYANEDSDEIETPVKPANLVKKENNQNANLKTVINNPKMNGAVNGFMQRNLPAVPVDNTYVQNQRANYYNNNLLIPIPVKKQNGYQTRSILNLMGDSRYLESGMIEDKNQNLMYVMQNGKVVKTFPIMTGLSKDGNVNDKGLNWMESHPVEAAKMRATPVGTYFSNPANNLYGKKGFRMKAIPAFGQPAPLAKDLAQHVVYGNAPVGEYGHDPAEYARRLKIMKGPGVNRVGSYGCTNMYGEDIDCLTGELFPKGDTTIVVDTRNPKDKKFINTLLNQNQYGGEPQNAGFQALPDYVQEKIMANMAEGGNFDELSNELEVPVTYDGEIKKYSDPRHLESGMITDKNKGVMYVIKNGKSIKTFPVMTALNKDLNKNPYGVAYLDKHPKKRATPVGNYLAVPMPNIYGRPGFDLRPISAFGQPAPVAASTAIHTLYGDGPKGSHSYDPVEYKKRLKIMAGPGANRVGSYGCTNMYGQDINCLTGELFPKGDTNIIIDSRIPADRRFINNLLSSQQFGGEMKYGGIHLDPAKKGTFKAQATRMGMSVQQAASHILANKEDYSPAMVKKANFAKNFAKEEGGEIDQYKNGGYIGMDGKFHMAKGSGTFSGNAYYVNGGEEDPNLTAPYDGSNPNAPLPPFDPSAYQATQLPTGYVGYSKKDPATGQFVPIDNVRKDDLWKHLSGSQRWNTGQTVTQKVGRGIGKIDDALNTGLVGAEAYSNYLKNNEAQNEYNNYTQNMGTTASLYGINAPAASRGDYSVTGSTYGTLKPNQYRQYSKMGGAIDQYAGGGGYISDELKFNNMDAPMVFTEGLANASNTYSTPDNTTVDRRFTPRMLPFNNEDNQTSYAKSGTDIATKLNNPTNMIYHPWMSKLGAQRSNIKQQDGDGFFAHFPDIDTALKAYETQLFGEVDGVFDSRYYKPNTTVDKALRTWSGNGYGGNIYPEIANKPLSSVTAAERRELAKRQIKSESGAMYSKLKSKGYFEMGGSYQEGGIVEMSDTEIKQFLANGGQLEFLD
jgi:hypothetical protein